MHIFTSIAANYIPKARVLANSVKHYHPEAMFHVVLSDTIPPALDLNQEPFDSIITVAELPIPNLKAWVFMHTLVELCTGVKGLAFQEIFKRYSCDKIIFFDPDIVVRSRLDRIFAALDTASVVLTPHQTEPEASKQAVMDNEICSLQHGVFNLGFLGVRNVPEGWRFLNWWTQRCLDFCYDDIPGGLFTDQRWIDLVPAFFTDFAVLRDPTYNVATWNLSNRIATGNLEEGILINHQPLCFFHFSGFDSGDQEVMLNIYGAKSPVLFKFREWYIQECERCGQSELGKLPCIYNFFENGEPITKAQRSLYRQRLDLQLAFPDPFLTQDINRSYYHWYLQDAKGSSQEAATDYTVYQAELAALRTELQQTQAAIAAMESSKFWQLRQAWFRLKKGIS
jgi:hypothetical protein